MVYCKVCKKFVRNDDDSIDWSVILHNTNEFVCFDCDEIKRYKNWCKKNNKKATSAMIEKIKRNEIKINKLK